MLRRMLYSEHIETNNAPEKAEMTNNQIIANLVSSLSRKIEWRMSEMEETYSEAKAKIAEQSVAGPAVWEKLDSIFN